MTTIDNKRITDGVEILFGRALSEPDAFLSRIESYIQDHGFDIDHVIALYGLLSRVCSIAAEKIESEAIQYLQFQTSSLSNTLHAADTAYKEKILDKDPFEGKNAAWGTSALYCNTYATYQAARLLEGNITKALRGVVEIERERSRRLSKFAYELQGLLLNTALQRAEQQKQNTNE